jgi:acetoacetate decarboxylase
LEPIDVVKSAFAMPLTSPAFARGPYRFTNREHLVITYRTSRDALDRAVPEPLVFDEPLVRCEFMRMESSTGFGRYSGAAQHIPVRLGDQHGFFTYNMYLDVYAPISGGRELWGFPQKLGTPRLVVDTDTLVGTLDFRSVQVARGTMGYKHHVIENGAATQLMQEAAFTLKIIPHVDGTPRICQLVRYFRQDVVLHGAWSGPCALDIQPHALAPMINLPVLEVVSGVHVIADFTLPFGEVVHDYLAQ